VKLAGKEREAGLTSHMRSGAGGEKKWEAKRKRAQKGIVVIQQTHATGVRLLFLNAPAHYSLSSPGTLCRVFVLSRGFRNKKNFSGSQR